MNFIFSWQKQYFAHSLHSLVNIVLPLENKIHIFAPPGNILYLYCCVMTNQISDQDMKANYKQQPNYHCCLKFISRLSIIYPGDDRPE